MKRAFETMLLCMTIPVVSLTIIACLERARRERPDEEFRGGRKLAPVPKLLKKTKP